MSIFEKVKAQVPIAEAAAYFGIQLNRADKACCPFHEEKTPSFSIKREDNIFTCFGCGAKGDVIELVSKLKEIEPLEAAKLLADVFRIDICDAKASRPKASPKAAPSKTAAPKKANSEIKEYLKHCIGDVKKTDYFARRGLTEETIKRFFLGYDLQRNAVVLPYSSKLNYYQTRSVTDKSFYKPRVEDAGPEPLFNKEALYYKGGPVFVVESPICAISVMQCGGLAVSLCGTTGASKLIGELKSKSTKSTLIICLDNDSAGVKASNALCGELLELGTKYIPFNIAGECKDPNELLMQNPAALQSNIKAAMQAAKMKYRTDKDSFSAAELQNTKLQPPRWLIDEVLCEGVSFLCAPSKMGKSWMALQMCLSVSAGEDFMGFRTHKTDCLYYALEDSKFRLQSRMNKLLKGKRAPENLFIAISSDTLDNGLLAQLSGEMEQHEGIGLIVIDTLQKVRGKASKTETAYANDYSEIASFKAFSSKFKVCILLVHHLRKMSDDSDVYNRINGSTGLMGAADTALVIDKKKRTDEEAVLHMTGRDIMPNDLVVRFDKDDCVWELVGTAEEQEAKLRQREYENNPIVRTIKGLLERDKYGYWEGSASELIIASADVLGGCMAETPVSVGQKLGKLKYKLYDDGIEYFMKSGKKNGRKHVFRDRVKAPHQVSLLSEN